MQSINEYEVFCTFSTGKGTYDVKHLCTVRGMHYTEGQELIIGGQYLHIKHAIRPTRPAKVNGKEMHVPDVSILLVTEASHNLRRHLDKVLAAAEDQIPKFKRLRAAMHDEKE